MRGMTPVPAETPAAAAPVTPVLARFVDSVQARLFPGAVDRGVAHLIGFCIILGAAVLMRRLITGLLFAQLRRFFARTQGALAIQARLFGAIERPTGVLIIVLGLSAALSLVELPAGLEQAAGYGERAAATAAVLWGLLCAGSAFLDHLADVARERRMGIAAFMPLLRKTFAAMFGIFAILMIAESLGVEVKAYLAGLGIGGLAFALAAQDTLSNVFGSFVVVLDHPFLVGDTVRIGASEGVVEDIGLRSTRLRTAERSLVVIPNKTVAGEAIVNLTRMPQRRVDQTIGLSYDAGPSDIEAMVADLGALLAADPGVSPGTAVVGFCGLGESSLDLQVVYYTANADWASSLAVRQRVNLAIMRAVAARGLEFAFPSRTVYHRGSPRGPGGPAVDPADPTADPGDPDAQPGDPGAPGVT